MSDIGKVMIDAGHGGEDPGAVFEGRREKDDALRLALAVGEILEDNGVDVMYTRVTDVYDTPQEKAEIANRSEADYLVSIHRNAMPVPGTASGIMSLVYENGGTVGRLGANINRELAQTGFADLGVVERRLQHSTIGRSGLNRRVRDGNGCVPSAHRHRNLFALDSSSKTKQYIKPLLLLP